MIKFSDCNVENVLVETVMDVSVVVATVDGDRVTIFQQEGDCYAFNDNYEFTVEEKSSMIVAVRLLKTLGNI